MSATAALALLTGAASAVSGGAAARPFPGIAFDDGPSGRLVVTARSYRLTLSKRDGRIVDVVDRAGETSVLQGSNGCLWRVVSRGLPSLRGGCYFRPQGANRFSYRWDPRSATLTLAYRSSDLGSVVVTLAARATFFDLRLTLENRGPLLTAVSLPDGLLGDVGKVEAGYAPDALPGVRLEPGFFSHVGNNIEVYPSRWAFADYLALDVGGGHVSLSSVAPGPIHPVLLGFLRQPPQGRCSGAWFCLVHSFQTWIARGESWTSPVVRVRIGQTARQSILAYRHDNGIDAYPSVQSKLGARLEMLARAPLIKADLTRTAPFREWGADLARLPSPALLHPVAFQPGGHDRSDPDFLPPDPRWGTSADFRSMVETAHSLGQLVMPYLNVSWWAEASPTMQALPPPLRLPDIAALDEHGNPVVDAYGDRSGVVVSPFVPFVRERVARLMDEWRTEVPADCVFFDQLGARPWIRDFNPASPDPEAYDDGWLQVMAPYSDRCLMVEDGWDRLARDFVGFHGSLLMMARELDLPNAIYGVGNWRPYPLADWLFHDKVLLYQHDLYDGTMAADAEVLTWNMAFGLISSYEWDDPSDSLESPWLELVGRFQRALGPHYAGVRLTGYRDLTPDVTESAFGDLGVVANWDSNGTFTTGGYGIAPQGFLARTRDGGLLAGAFAGTFDGAELSPGTHYLLIERDKTSVTVRQLLGADTSLAVEPPSAWSLDRNLQATALAPSGAAIGRVDGEVRDGRFVFDYARELDGSSVAGYRVAVGG